MSNGPSTRVDMRQQIKDAVKSPRTVVGEGPPTASAPAPVPDPDGIPVPEADGNWEAHKMEAINNANH